MIGRSIELVSTMISLFPAIALALSLNSPWQLRSRPIRCSTEAATSMQADAQWIAWASDHGVEAAKLSVRPTTPEERGKGGVFASEPIAPMEIIARIPKKLIVTADDAAKAAASAKGPPSWAAELTAAVLMALHPQDGVEGCQDLAARRAWIDTWTDGGWATNSSDLGADHVRWGPRDVTGSLLATGSDNDKAIYAKFRFPCHPVIHRAGVGLALLTKADQRAAIDALITRGTAYRAMRDALIPLVTTPSERSTGSLRDRRSWDVADALSRVLSRATQLEPDDEGPVCAIVPLHERLGHCDARGENAKLVGADPRSAADDGSVLLVATREIAAGEAITRDYYLAPQLAEDRSDGALRLLLQHGLPPAAWAE